MTGLKTPNLAKHARRDRPKSLFRHREIEIHVVGVGIRFGATTEAWIALAREEEES